MRPASQKSVHIILSTHAIVGGAIASLMPDQPALAFVAGIASHFVIDAVRIQIIRCARFRSTGTDRQFSLIGSGCVIWDCLPSTHQLVLRLRYCFMPVPRQ